MKTNYGVTVFWKNQNVFHALNKTLKTLKEVLPKG